ncbi:MAG: DUF2079 domain-containing protein [Synechococcus sp.]
MTCSPSPDRPPSPGRSLPAPLIAWAAGVGLLLWGLAAARHGLLQSNAYDLGLFDQWAWLIGSGAAPISSMEHVHVLADHGAWMLYLAGGAYRVMPSLQWLLASQALALSVTALPIWLLAQQAGLKPRQCWLVCALWWLQPVVFNAALFDFHPETWVMPAFALALWAERSHRPRLWFGLLLLMLGCRDGLVLITAGMAVDLAWRRRWRWSLTAAGLSAGWLLMLSRWLYPLLRDGDGPKAASRMFSHLSGGPFTVLSGLDWGGGAEYLLLLCLPCIVLWRRASFSTLLIGLPLVLVNLLSASASYRTLVHHYSLPLAVVAVVAAVDGLRQHQASRRGWPWTLGWAVACWLALAKPWFFTGPYLQRLPLISAAQSAIPSVQPTDAVLTTSYLVPHLSQRTTIGFPKKSRDLTLEDAPWTVLLLNPSDPGWGSSKRVQKQLLNQAKDRNWSCRDWPAGLEFCRAPAAAEQQPRLGNAPSDTDQTL